MLQCLRHIYQCVHTANKDVHGLLAKENKEGLTQRHRQPSAAARPSADLKQAFNPQINSIHSILFIHYVVCFAHVHSHCQSEFIPDTCKFQRALYLSLEKLLCTYDPVNLNILLMQVIPPAALLTCIWWVRGSYTGRNTDYHY